LFLSAIRNDNIKKALTFYDFDSNNAVKNNFVFQQ
jgi:hypothetical protein